jgi:hypothetical protein
MTQFHEGQDVEVARAPQGARPAKCRVWEKAKIVSAIDYPPTNVVHTQYEVQFPDGLRDVFDEAHIMPARELCIDCGKELADFPSKLCPGCEAYRERYA